MTEEDPGLFSDDDRALLAQVAQWPGHSSPADLTPPSLARLAAERGIDFATALLYDRLRRSDRHGPFIRRIDALLSDPPAAPAKMDVLVAVAPGAYYRELPRTGADGWLLRQRVAAHGCRTAVIPTHSMAAAGRNGRVICDWLAEHSDETIVLASLSKAAGDVKAALAEPDAATAFRPVRAWLNLSGITFGSPVANWLLRRNLDSFLMRALCWWKGLDFGFVKELRWGRGAVLDFPLVLPPHLELISVVGFPLRCHLTTAVLRRFHRRVAPLGPNDGMILLAEACALPGVIYPVWGADHNLRPAWDVRRLVEALACCLTEDLTCPARS